MQPYGFSDPVYPNKSYTIRQRDELTPPEFVFHTPPMGIMFSYYDYFPGSYQSIPLRVQPSPSGVNPGDGMYLAFQATPAIGEMRRVYITYFEDGVMTMAPYSPEPQASLFQGFPGIDIDWETGNPLISWHEKIPGDAEHYISPFMFDNFSLEGIPGLWSNPYDVINNPHTIDGIPGQEFLWPSVFVGPSPHAGQRRVFVIARNFTPNLSDLAIETPLIAFADFAHPTELSDYNPAAWTYVTIPIMNEWRSMDIRPFYSFAVSRQTGRLAVAGHTQQMNTTNVFHPNDFFFILENENYGEGEWTLYTEESTIPVNIPVPIEMPYYEDTRFRPLNNRHTTVIDDEGNYHFVAFYTIFDIDYGWFPYFSTTKQVKFNRVTEEFIIRDLYPRNADGSFYLPWAPWWPNIVYYFSYPCYWYDYANQHQENYHRIIQDGPRMVALFQESTKAMLYHKYNQDEHSDWANIPSTYIMISGDY